MFKKRCKLQSRNGSIFPPFFSLYGNIPYYSYILNSIEVLKACRFITYFLINEARSIGSYVIT